MEILTILNGFGLLEWLIVGFIGANMTLSGAYLIQRGAQKLGAGEE